MEFTLLILEDNMTVLRFLPTESMENLETAIERAAVRTGMHKNSGSGLQGDGRSLQELFWHNFLLSDQVGSGDISPNLLKKSRISIRHDGQYLLILVSAHKTPVYKNKDMAQAAAHLCANLFKRILKDGAVGYHFALTDSPRFVQVFIVEKESLIMPDARFVEDQCSALAESYDNPLLIGRINCFLDGFGGIMELGKSFRKLMLLADKNAGYTGQTVFVEENRDRSSVPGVDIAPYVIKWEQFLTEGQKAKLLHSIKAYVNEVNALHVLDASFCSFFQQCLIQTVDRVTERWGIRVDARFQNEWSLYKNTFQSAAGLVKWAEHFTRNAIDYIAGYGKLADKVKAYIQEQYASGITRQDISNVFFINADYLSRLFNKKFGMSIPDYITQLRVERAKELLHTTLSVSAVSSLVGIDNYSYFSKVFKKAVGVTPSAYRKKIGDATR